MNKDGETVMNQIIIPAGYMGSGSSAITDICSEIADYRAVNGSFEYIFMHCPDGIFDLEDKLLRGNNALRSDEALRSFSVRMYELYHSKLWWPGNYRKNIGPEFWKMTEEYIDSLTQYQPEFFWYMQTKFTPLIFVKMVLRKILRVVSAGKISLRRPLLYSPMRISLPTETEFYEKTKKYLMNIFRLLGLEENHLVLDQLLLPFNVWRFEHYFDKNTKCFVVERDPRDVFISNKYIWPQQEGWLPYPTDVSEFCTYYRRLREMEMASGSQNVYRIHFEDLVYCYEESLLRIYDILDVSPAEHVKKGTIFQPERSIENTQLFQLNTYKKEREILENELSEYLYDFPYVREVNIKKVF